jgi:hypothetical protein
MKVCQNCHTENHVDAVFCSECGDRLQPLDLLLWARQNAHLLLPNLLWLLVSWIL